MITFENYDRKISKIMAVLNRYGIKDLEDAADICRQNGIDPYETAKTFSPYALKMYAMPMWPALQ